MNHGHRLTVSPFNTFQARFKEFGDVGLSRTLNVYKAFSKVGRGPWWEETLPWAAGAITVLHHLHCPSEWVCFLESVATTPLLRSPFPAHPGLTEPLSFFMVSLKIPSLKALPPSSMEGWVGGAKVAGCQPQLCSLALEISFLGSGSSLSDVATISLSIGRRIRWLWWRFSSC